VHQARAFAGGNTARCRRARDALRKKPGVDVARGPRPDAGADLRFRAVRGDREEGTVGGTHFDGIAELRLAFDFRDGPGEYPGMPAFQRFLAAGFEYESMQFKNLSCPSVRISGAVSTFQAA